MPNLSRRHLVTTAAALPALALPAAVLPVAALAKPITAPAELDPVIKLAEQAIKAWREFDEANARFQPFDEAMIEWRKKNPGPAKPETQYNPKGAWHPATGNWFDVDRGPYISFKMEEVVLLEKSVDADTSPQGHKAAVARWKRRERAAERRTGYAKADDDQMAACERSDEAIAVLIDTRPRTMPGLAAKARAARITQDEGLYEAITFDIGILAGEIERQAVQS